MRTAPLARYKHNFVAFTHELTPLVLNENEQKVLSQFENGMRRGLGFHAWASDGLCRALYLSYAVILWRTLCFEGQLTGIYGKSKTKALPWINGLSIFVNRCDPLIRTQLMFDVTQPRVTLSNDEFWRIILFNPNESEEQAAKEHLTNVVYYDFNRIPEWLIRETQRSLDRPNAPQTCTLAILMQKPTNLPVAPPTEPPPYVDGSSDTDD